MATSQLTRVIQTLRSATLHHEGVGLTDGQLLDDYVSSRAEAAFAALVGRHGPMVWGVCRRVLGSHHDAEDAFQATFLVLVRKAASLVQREKVANWLYGVAHQTALKARATTAKRQAREKQVTAMPEPAQPQAAGDDLQVLLDQELSRLPDKYRAVLVLCDLEGKTRKEAARHINVPEGTVASRLATARAMLAKRLARHGLAVSGAVLAPVLAPQGASASMPLSVAASTIQAASLFAAGQAAAPGVISAKAVALAEGVLKTMLLTKLKIATAVLVAVVVLGAGAATLTLSGPAEKSADQPIAEKQAPAEKPADPPAKPKKEPTPTPATEKKDAEAPPTVVNGVVKAVDAEKNTLTVAHKQGESTFNVAPDAHISIDLKPGKLAGLPPGANITLSQFVDAKTAGNIQAGGSSIFGSVKAVEMAKSTITVAGNPDDRTFSVTKDTSIVIDGKPGQLAGIPRGASLHALNLCVDQQTTHSINVEGPGFHHVPVKAVDAEKGTITFGDQAPAAVAGKTIPLAQNADFRIDGKPAKVAGLPAGAFVNLILTVDQATARRLDAEGPHLGGCGGSMVKAVSAGQNTITFDDKALPEVAGKTFTFAPDVNILIDGKPGKLTELPAGAFVNLILSVDQQVARHVHAQGPHASGVVKAVSAKKNTITVDDTVYTVAQDAIVVIDGKVGALGGLPVGASVNLNLRVD
jgi:RNA polymerase sigma factor (sigma-70 family)